MQHGQLRTSSFPRLSTSSRTNSSSTSTSQDLLTSPAQERSDELAPRECCGSPSTTQNKNQKRMTVEMRTTVCEIFLSGWRGSTENLGDADVPAPAHISHDSDSERPAKVALRTHSIYSHFPKDRSPVRFRCSRSCHSMDSILSVQNKNFTRDVKEFTKVHWAVTKAESSLYGQFIGIRQILWRFIVESSHFNTSSIRDEWYCWKSRSIATIGIGWKMVGWYCGMLLLSAKCPRPPGGWEGSLWKTVWRSIQRTNNSLFGAMFWFHPISPRDQSRLHQLGKKVLSGIFLGY